MKEPDKKIPKLSKQEIKNILERGWLQRREKLKTKSEKNSQYSKEWQDREKLFKKYGIPQARERREGHYITTPDIITARPRSSYIIDQSKGYWYIYCKICHHASYNPHDIKNKYCGNCKMFHD